MTVLHRKSGLYISGMVALAGMVVLMVVALIFWKERMTFLDAPFILFRMINADALNIMESRYGAIASQLLPYLGIKLQLPLVLLMWLYNLSFNAFYLLVACLLARWRQYELVVIMALYFTVTAGEAFFWTNNEIHQAVAWMFLWLGLFSKHLAQDASRVKMWGCFIPLGFFAVVTHPLMLLVVPFVWVWMVLTKWRLSMDRVLKKRATAVVVGLLLLRLILSLYSGWYDADKLSGIQSGPSAEWLAVFGSPVLTAIWQLFFLKYYGFFTMVLLATGGLIYYRQWRLLLITLAFTAAYLWLFLLVFPEYIPFYSDSELMPLNIVWGLPLVWFFLKKISSIKAALLTAALLLSGFVFLFQASGKYSDRLDTTYLILDRMQAGQMSKAVVGVTSTLQSHYIMYWGSPVESLFAGAIRGDEQQRTFIIVPEREVHEKASVSENIFHDCFQPIHLQTLNERYFSIDSSSLYRILEE